MSAPYDGVGTVNERKSAVFNNNKKEEGMKMTSIEPPKSSSCLQCGLKFSNEDIQALHECLQIKQEKTDLEHIPEEYLKSVPEYLTDTIVKQEISEFEIKEENWFDYEEPLAQQEEDPMIDYYQQNEILEDIQASFILKTLP